ncbi:MAG: SDR family NAD(P)-dependent oxidoreductase [Bdellovibrionia bacterium]
MKNFKNTLITGASAGIGKGLAWEFAARGHNLVLLARREDLLLKIKKEIELQHSVRVLVSSTDVTDEAQLHSAVKQAVAEIGPIDTVIANAGFGVGGPFEKLSIQDYQRQFDVNVFGVLRTIYATLDSLKITQGRLCLIGSACSYITIPGDSAYCMSKFALRSLAEALYGELATAGISVTLINPGFIVTDIRMTGNDGVFNPNWRDPVPRWLMMDAGTAARKIYKAVAGRKRERAITAHSQMIIWISRFFPGLVAFGSKKVFKRN